MSAGGAIGTTIVIFGVGLIFTVIGYLIDFIRHTSISYTLAYSQLALMDQLTMVFIAAGFLFLLAAVIHHLLIAKSERTGYV